MKKKVFYRAKGYLYGRIDDYIDCISSAKFYKAETLEDLRKKLETLFKNNPKAMIPDDIDDDGEHVYPCNLDRIFCAKFIVTKYSSVEFEGEVYTREDSAGKIFLGENAEENLSEKLVSRWEYEMSL